MKKILIAALCCMAVSVQASDVYRVYIGQSNEIAHISRDRKMADPTPLGANEVRFHYTYEFPAVPTIHMKYDGTNVVSMTAEEIVDKDAREAQAASDRKDAQAISALNTPFNKALAKTIAEFVGTQATNVSAVFKAYYRAELDN